jgi:REP element-mobilizing transposase RayT
MLKKHQHNPAHLFVDNSPYFITGSIYQNRNLLQSNSIKDYLLATIRQCFEEKAWLLNDWVILDNHYHLLGISKKRGGFKRYYWQNTYAFCQIYPFSTSGRKTDLVELLGLLSA